MSFYLPGNRVIDSTTLGTAANPSTTTILAELTSENFQSTQTGRQYVVNITLGGSTSAAWVVEQTTSSNVNSTTIMTQTVYYTSPGQTSQFVARYTVSGVERLRARHFSSNTGSFAAKLSAEEIS